MNATFDNLIIDVDEEWIAEEGIKTIVQDKSERMKISKACKEGFKNATSDYKNTGKTTEMKKFIKWVDGNVREISSRMKNADPKEVKHLKKLKDIYVGWKSSASAWLTEKM